MEDMVLASIRPYWDYLIFKGDKGFEIRKRKPKLPPPFRVAVYCTQPDIRRRTICGGIVLNDDELFIHPRLGLQYGDSICLMCEDGVSADNFLNGKVIGEFVCDRVEEIRVFPNGSIQNWNLLDLQQSCLTYDQIAGYVGAGKTGYAWHITDPALYERPKQLSDFGLARPPQSWQYLKNQKGD